MQSLKSVDSYIHHYKEYIKEMENRLKIMVRCHKLAKIKQCDCLGCGFLRTQIRIVKKKLKKRLKEKHQLQKFLSRRGLKC